MEGWRRRRRSRDDSFFSRWCDNTITVGGNIGRCITFGNTFRYTDVMEINLLSCVCVYEERMRLNIAKPPKNQ